MKNWKNYLIRRAALAMLLLALAGVAPSIAQAQTSAEGSKKPGTVVDPAAAGGPETGRRGDAERVSSPRASKGADLSVPPAIAGGLTRRDVDAARPLRTGMSALPVTQALINSCAAAVDDLTKTRILADALERENALLRERLETEKRTSAVLLELNETRKAEAVSLRETLLAKNEALSAKDEVIAAQDKLIETLKKKKTSPLKRLGDVLIGVGLAAVFR